MFVGFWLWNFQITNRTFVIHFKFSSMMCPWSKNKFFYFCDSFLRVYTITPTNACHIMDEIAEDFEEKGRRRLVCCEIGL
ncbi:MAG: hypothetical protein A2Z25_19550 [Planctomycetes bacterium RBG_16_55_9]|nr:MAG: hypothetical protein A2Z25_19550 [Planctomycetes bacterium RBG_16_55_9]